MDRRGYMKLFAIPVAAMLVGCGTSSAPQQPTAKTSQKTAKDNKKPTVGATPGEAVSCFLEAVRRGDDAGASGMLTDRARRKTREINMVVAPPGSDTARYRVGKTTVVRKGIAQVASAWTDLDNEGKPRTDQITWTVRHGSHGWRIAGMTAKVAADRPPIQLDFENPQEMLRRQKLAEQEALERAAQTQRQARRTNEDPFQSSPR